MLRSILSRACLVAPTVFLLAGGPEDDVISGTVTVRMLPGVPVQSLIDQFAVNNQALGLELALVDTIPGRGIHLLQFDPTGLDDVQLDALEDQFDVDCVDPPDPACPYAAMLTWGEALYEGQAPEGRTGTFWLSLDPGAPETLFTDQYAAGLLGLPQAQQTASGNGIVVALIDTGIDAQHPLMAGRIVAGGIDFVDGDPLPAEGAGGTMSGHGTFVAGLVSLVAPGAKFLPIRVLDANGLGDNWTIARGFFYAIDHGVEVINASLGSTYRSDAVEDALDEAKAAGITVVCAAGNQNSDVPEYPAMFVEDGQPLAIAVVATDDFDVKAVDSSYGIDVSLAAPGTRVLLAQSPPEIDLDRSVISALPGGGFGAWEGTSMSTALVSGAAALIRAQHPQWPTPEVPLAEISTVIRSAISDVPVSVYIDGSNPGYEGQLGRRLDVAAAVAMGPPEPALGDLDGSGAVGMSDLLALLAAWGQVHSSADLDGDGLVGINDLLILLGAWG